MEDSEDLTAVSRYRVRIGCGGLIAVERLLPAQSITARVFLDDLPMAEAFWNSMSPRAADWGDIAVAVYAADRLCKRDAASRFEWVRDIALEVPVRDISFWRAQEIDTLLRNLLAYITDDSWTLTFSKRTDAPRLTENPVLFPQTLLQPAAAALFSGGLDSLAGLATFALSNGNVNIATFSARTSKRAGRPQRFLLNALARHFPGRLFTTSAAFGFRDRVGHSFDHEERSQRTRGFVFQALGSITAVLAGANELMIFENGVGAVNLPYLDSQLGSQSTRATSPVTLAMMSRLNTLIFDSLFVVTLPFLFATKAEVCAVLRNEHFSALVRDSVSCDHFPQRRTGHDQCGACSSCLLRRQSLYESGLGAFDRKAYVHDVFHYRQYTGTSRWFALHAMDCQADLIERAFRTPTPAAALFRTFPTLDEAAAVIASSGRPTAQADLVALYKRYASEWAVFREACNQSRPGEEHAGH